MGRIAIASLGLAATMTSAVLVKPALASSFTYTVLSHGEQTVATAVNSAGQVTGSYGANNTSQAFVWQKGRFTAVLLPKGAISIDSVAINDNGVATGVASLKTAWRYQAGIYTFDTKTGTTTLQIKLPRGQIPQVGGIDNAGDIVFSLAAESLPVTYYAYTLSKGKTLPAQSERRQQGLCQRSQRRGRNRRELRQRGIHRYRRHCRHNQRARPDRRLSEFCQQHRGGCRILQLGRFPPRQCQHRLRR
jgi:hypothetical protein